MNEDSLVEKLVYRLIKKHVAGTTMNSAIVKVQEFNKNNMLASIVFLSGRVETKVKARYVTTTYIELIRRISRMGLKSVVQIPIGQIGGAIDEEFASGNLSEIIDAGNKYGVFIWAAINGSQKEATVAKQHKHAKGFGIAAPYGKVAELVDKWHIKAVKIIFDDKDMGELKAMADAVRLACAHASTVVLYHPPEKLVGKELQKVQKQVVMEFGLGHDRKRLRKLLERSNRISVSIPFGKDWTSYAMEIVPEGKTHFIVESLLRGEGQVA